MEIDNEILASHYARALLDYTACLKDTDLAVRIGAFTTFLGLYRRRLGQLDTTFYEKLGHIFDLEACRIDLLARLLFKQDRLLFMPDVMRHFFELYKKEHQLLFCTLKTSHELTPDQKDVLITFIGQISAKEIVFSVKIDRSLIAGVRIEGDEMVWESSVARQLRVIEQLQ